jgi:superfamily II DNA or RNA helicase
MIDHLFTREPWPHQRFGVEQTIDALSNGVKSVCLTSPTGSGKTDMMIALSRWGVEELGGTVLCLTNRILLTDQTRGVFQAAGVSVGVISSSMKWAERDTAQVQIATIQTILARRRAKPSYWVDADLVLVDEVHQQATGQAAELINEYKERGSKVCGVTATPLGVCNVCDELIVAARTRDLQDQGILCYASWFAPSELDTRKLVKGKVDLSLTENDARKTWGPLRGDDQIRTRIVGNILEHYRRLHPEQTHTLAFAPGVKESLWAAQFCQSRGIRALHVDGEDFWADGRLYDRKQDEQKFQDAMQRWRDGEIPICWNRFVLREGIDEPQIRCLMLATPVGSFRSCMQMVGRSLRTHDSKGRVMVIDFGGNWWRHFAPEGFNVNVDWEPVFDCQDPDVLSKNRIAKQREDGEPMGRVCPKCGMVHKQLDRLTVCQYCGHKLSRGKPSRPILQADGKLTEVTGEPIAQWTIRRTPECETIWKGLYWNAMRSPKHEGKVSFDELFNQFHYKTAVMAGTRERPAWWKAYHPPRDLPLMPTRVNDWHRDVCEISGEKLIG